MISPREPIDVYPGTHRPLGTPTPARATEDLYGWDENPIFKKIEGHWREFFGISHLSEAILRAPKTIYKWEERGYFPRPTFLYNPTSKNGQRRLYTRVQVEGVVVIAHEEGLLGGTKRFVSQTLFPLRCTELFRTTRALLPPPTLEGNPRD